MTHAEQIEFSAFIENNFNLKSIHEIADNTNFMRSKHLAAIEIQKQDAFEDIKFLVLNETPTKTTLDHSVLLMEALYYKRKYEAVLVANTAIEKAKAEG